VSQSHFDLIIVDDVIPSQPLSPDKRKLILEWAREVGLLDQSMFIGPVHEGDHPGSEDETSS